MTRPGSMKGRAYLLELLDSSRNRHYFQIEAENDDMAHLKSEDIITQYMTAVSTVYQTAEVPTDGPPIDSLMEQLSVNSNFLLEQSQVRLVNPDYSDLPEEGLELLHRMSEKSKRGQSPIRETLLWQLREVQ